MKMIRDIHYRFINGQLARGERLRRSAYHHLALWYDRYGRDEDLWGEPEAGPPRPYHVVTLPESQRPMTTTGSDVRYRYR